MKVNNIEKFREEIFKHMKEMYFTGCDVSVLAATKFDDTEENKMKVTHLYNPLQIKKSHFNHDTWKEIVDAQYYITVSDIDGAVDFWETKKGDKCFNWLHGIELEDVSNKTIMMMTIVQELMTILNK